MNFIAIFSLLLISLVGFTYAQNCFGQPRNRSCFGARDVGRGGRGCIRRTMWYYDTRGRRCREMVYNGCGGNNNRWCTRTGCEQNCRR